MARRAVFLDRDGVINRAVVLAGKPHPPTRLHELELLPGVVQGLEALKRAGYQLVVVTNQPDVARGKTARSAVDAMNCWLKEALPLDAILTCFHDDQDECSCRKPRPGLITQAACELDIELKASWLVGDRWRDIEAGRRAGCRTFFIDHAYDEPAPRSYDFAVGSLLAAALIILREDRA
jgi:D-glycero-D-manno-heptose 1,7-bisphosphate phosphatase